VLPPDQQPPTLVLAHQDSSKVILRPFSQETLDGCVYAFDFEDLKQPNLTMSGADVLQMYLSSPQLTASLPFSVQDNAYGPVLVTFSATDSAGNQAASVALPVYISSSAAVCTASEVLCTSGHCSTEGLCLHPKALELLTEAGFPSLSISAVHSSSCAQNGSTDAPSHFCTYLPVVDRTPPIVTALGGPPEHVRVHGRVSGKIVLETSVAVGAQYSDAGAIALDDIDGDVTASLSRAGLSLVSTSAPTAPGVPFVVRYSAYDRSGNAAEPAERHVRVLCSQHSRTCTLEDGTAYCSVSSTECLEPSPLQAVAGSGFALPTISLIGPSEVEILQGTAYGACTDSTPISLQCDRGAKAQSPSEGDLTWTVMACKDGFAFRQYGLRACDVDTSVVGSHNITFFLVHGGNRIAVNRTLWVLERCHGARSFFSHSCSFISYV
jgi:hypothetical protein